VVTKYWRFLPYNTIKSKAECILKEVWPTIQWDDVNAFHSILLVRMFSYLLLHNLNRIDCISIKNLNKIFAMTCYLCGRPRLNDFGSITKPTFWFRANILSPQLFSKVAEVSEFLMFNMPPGPPLHLTSSAWASLQWRALVAVSIISFHQLMYPNPHQDPTIYK